MGVSFVAIFLLAYIVVFWVFGGAYSISWDYLPGIPQGEAAERRVSWKEKPIGGWIARHFFAHIPESMPNTTVYELEKKSQMYTESEAAGHVSQNNPQPINENSMAICSSDTNERQSPPRGQDATSVPTPGSRKRGQVSINNQSFAMTCAPSRGHQSKHSSPLALRLRRMVKPLMDPVAITILVSLPIALVKPLKALFVDTRDVGGPDWHGPDGRPPLFFIIDSGWQSILYGRQYQTHFYLPKRLL